MPTPYRRRALALALGCALALLAGCGLRPGDADGTPREHVERVLADVREAVEREVDEAVAQAKESNRRESGDVSERPPAGTGELIRTDTRTAFDYAEYQQTLEQVLGALEAYWAEALPATFGVEYRSPARYVYYRPEEQPGPRCGPEPAPERNAFYCPPGDFLAWDETGLMIPYYVSAGDFAAAFVLAHEFGHAMQARLPEREPLGVLTELQADCFAGAWSRAMQERGLLEAGDLDEATLAVFAARDVPGTPFTDPRAHGTGFERTRAFTDGYEGGPGRCYPAPVDSWTISR